MYLVSLSLKELSLARAANAADARERTKLETFLDEDPVTSWTLEVRCKKGVRGSNACRHGLCDLES